MRSARTATAWSVWHRFSQIGRQAAREECFPPLFPSYAIAPCSASHSYGIAGETAFRKLPWPGRERPHGRRQDSNMTATPLTYPGFSRPRPARLAPLPAPFQPLDPAVINASIPTFYIGRSRDGSWLAREANGENGGVFLFKRSAMAFARRVSRPNGCALVFLSERFELDVENQGNRLVGYLKPLLRLLNLAGRDAGR